MTAFVLAPPPIKGRPDDFIDAVGRFVLTGEIDPSRFRLDERATLTLKLEGAGDLSNAHAPDLAKIKTFAERFDVVGPTKRSIDENSIRFDYPIRARAAGATAAPSIRLSVYDDSPPRPHYQLLRTAELPVEVLPAPASDVVFPAVPPQPADSWWRRYGTSLLLSIAVMLAAALLVKTIRRSIPPPAAGEGRVGGITPSPGVNRNHSRTGSSPFAGFVRSGADQWLDRLGDALAVPLGSRTTNELLAAASRAGLDDAMVSLLYRNLANLDARRFGGGTAEVDERELNVALEVIDRNRSGIAHPPASGDPMQKHGAAKS